MIKHPEQIIARALIRCLNTFVEYNQTTRIFVRLEDFPEEVYRVVLEKVQSTLNRWKIWVRTVGQIDGFSHLQIEKDRSATWYRNHLPVGYMLLLIFNRRASDAQSLKDMYVLSSGSLIREHLTELIEASIQYYQMSSDEQRILTDFVQRRLRRLGIEPALSHLVSFFLEIDQLLNNNDTDTIEQAIAKSLPHLRLFRCLELANTLRKPRANKIDKILRDIRDAARIGFEIIDESRREQYLRNLDQAHLSDDRITNGLSADEKKQLLRAFINGELAEKPDQLQRVFCVDWDEVQQIIKPRRRKITNEQVIAELNDVVGRQPDDDVSELITQLRNKVEIERPLLERVLDNHREFLSSEVQKELRRHMRPREVQAADFLVGLLSVLIDIRHLHEDEEVAGAQTIVEFLETDQPKQSITEAAQVFRSLYGGIEQRLTNVKWKLDELWKLVEAEEDVDDEEERHVELRFRVQLTNQQHTIAKANLVWEYRSDSLAAATYRAFAHERARLQSFNAGPLFALDIVSLSIPIYVARQGISRIADLNLYRPLYTFGHWYKEYRDARQMLDTAIRDLNVPSVIKQALEKLEQEWANFVQMSANGLLGTHVDSLIKAYRRFLETVLEHLTKPQWKKIYQTINRMWIISEESVTDWAVVPLIHPLKLYWWQQRATQYNDFIAQLFHPKRPARAINDKQLQREISIRYGSWNMPPAIALANDKRQSDWYLAQADIQGYTLFQRVDGAGGVIGFHIDDLAEDEQTLVASHVIETLVSVIQDYVETYPFTRDGITITLLECSNSALPVLLLKRLCEANPSTYWPSSIRLVVHTSNYGATLYRRIDEWLSNEISVGESTGSAYLPKTLVEVRECSLDELLQSSERSDIVGLIDLFPRSHRMLEPIIIDPVRPSMPQADLFQIRPEPFREGDNTRRLQLIPDQKPDILRLFLLCQYASNLPAGKTMPHATKDLQLNQLLSLENWQVDLEHIHQHFNWVICYDQVIDRFLLQSACNNHVRIIRCAAGLGVQRLYHLTVSSARRTQDVVVRRLADRFVSMMPSTGRVKGLLIAESIADIANEISGDVVLRAAGPGLFLNELIGLVAAKFCSEQEFHRQYPQWLPVWILLDDFRHWFQGGKMPDLLLVGLSEENGQAHVYLQVIEAKCVNADTFEHEANDARTQVYKGVSRLAQVFAPNSRHLDSSFWYDQFYRAIAGSVKLNDEQFSIWETIRERLYNGDYLFQVRGCSYIFCYDDQAGILDGPISKPFSKPTADALEVQLTEHFYGRNELIEVLHQLMRQRGGLDQDETIEAMRTLHDVPPLSDADIDDNDQSAGEMSQASESLGVDRINKVIYFPSPIQERSEEGRAVAERPTENTVTSQSERNLSSLIPPIEDRWLEQRAREIERALRQRGMQLYPINVADTDQGPSIVRFKFRLKPNQQLKRLQNVAEDLARDLKLPHPPYIANVPETDFVGIDIPRSKRELVYLRPLLEQLPKPGPAELPIVIGISPDGKVIIDDLAEFPHLLVAGATKSGKSVFLRNLLLSLLTVYRPSALELLIIDPKQTDFTLFNNLSYLRSSKVIVERKAARDALLTLAREEMPRRQKIMAHRSMNIKSFNQRYPSEALPPVVALIDEYGLLTSQMDKKERDAFEQSLSELAAAARAVGIHIVLATQHPSAEVITPKIKANLDARVALRVAANVNSRVVLDTVGAENLLGQGDMLFRRPDGRILRLQAPFMDENELVQVLESFR